MTVRTRHNLSIAGQGTQPMLFAHGFGCDQHMWRFVAPAFEKEFKTILFDYVGHGRSDFSAYDEQKYSGLHGYVDDVLALCSELDLHDVVLVGHSVSAVIGILAAIQEPARFASLILVSPSPCYINEGDYVGGFSRETIEELLEFLDKNHLGWSSAMAPTIMGNADRPELGQELTESFCRTDPDVAKQFARVTFLSDSRAELHKLAVPSLILQSAHDIIAPPSVGNYMAANLPQSQIVTLDCSGHCPHLSAPTATLAAMKAFLSTASR